MGTRVPVRREERTINDGIERGKGLAGGDAYEGSDNEDEEP
jgi:hypothetical protein